MSLSAGSRCVILEVDKLFHRFKSLSIPAVHWFLPEKVEIFPRRTSGPRSHDLGIVPLSHGRKLRHDGILMFLISSYNYSSSAPLLGCTASRRSTCKTWIWQIDGSTHRDLLLYIMWSNLRISFSWVAT